MSIYLNNVNFAAASTFLVSSIVDIACTIALSNPAISATSKVAFGFFRALGFAGEVASISAWSVTKSGRVSDYTENFRDCFALMTALATLIVSKSLLMSYLRPSSV